jgi:hypothetical protein
MTVIKEYIYFLFEHFKKCLENRVVFSYCHVSYFLEPGWTLIFNRSKSSAGTCRSDRKITISNVYINAVVTTLNDVIDTLLHEFAHAIAGLYHGHDVIWYTISKLIGCTGEQFCNTIFAPYKYRMICPKGCCHYRHLLKKGVYTNRTEGYAICPKHRELPVFVTKIDDNTQIKSYSQIEDLYVIYQKFTENK